MKEPVFLFAHNVLGSAKRQVKEIDGTNWHFTWKMWYNYLVGWELFSSEINGEGGAHNGKHPYVQ